QLSGVAARIFNTYKPLLAVAALCVDDDFKNQIHTSLLLETAELNEAQAAEPDGLVLRAIVEVIFSTRGAEFRNIRLSDLAELIWRNHKLQFQPRQVGRMARELGFETKTSHGVTVVVPTPATLIRASDECGYTDEAMEELRKQFGVGAERQS